MNKVTIVSVGKLKSSHWQKAAAEYITRLGRVWQINQLAVRDGDARSSPQKKSEQEGERILAALEPEMVVVCLDERGKAPTSLQFAGLLAEWMQNKARHPCFVVGGAYGLSEAVRGRADYLLGLGPLTLPHELAQVLLLEQLYRAWTIQTGQPYHHA
ncbi:MAG: 23S rRNA (pseudouridine(1915)-N(3))-methyltransferase RlmH [Desulfovibrionaceae bacterium]|nr:23S rRNA (pseudouridine(1915)-N(3))-methyltransferase RlmH [Desulfovibrionaceae bacterium]